MGPRLRDNYTSTSPRPDWSVKNNGAMKSEMDVGEQKNGGRKPYLECVERGSFAGECTSVLICVSQGTTHVEVPDDWAPDAYVSPVVH